MKLRFSASCVALHAAVLTVCTSTLISSRGAMVEPTITPTVHPILTPTSAIPSPLRFAGDQISAWQANLEQRILLSGRVTVAVGYRQLKADTAAVWLTPSRESGESTFEVAIYLSGNVEVREGSSASATRTMGKELLVTTRVSQNVQLAGNLVPKSEEDSPIVQRGLVLRNEVLNRPASPVHIPTIVITPAEEALQAGWIARGPNNRIILGPGETQLVRGPDGKIIPGAVPPPPAKPRPNFMGTADDIRSRTDETTGEVLTIGTGAFVVLDYQDGKPPLIFRAQRMVAFSPAKSPASQPADAAKDASQYITGVYLEGDVTVDQGEQLMVRAERVYYDFTSQRAVMLDATLSTVDEVRGVPVYMRAAEIRQLARGQYAAKKATFSTSEFFTPHYHIGASEIYLHDITAPVEGGGGPEPAGPADQLGLGFGGSGTGQKTYQFEAKDTTIDIQGVPIFFLPWLAGNTSKNEIPLRTIRVSNSKTYGLSLLTDWDIFGLAGQAEPEGMHADLNLDYYGKRGPATGVQADWHTADDRGILRTYALLEQGTDRLGTNRENVLPDQQDRGRATLRNQRDLGNGLTLQVEASYISDPTFLEQFFEREFDADKEHETSLYLKKQGETDALTLLGKFSLFDFTATADQIDDQFTTEKKPELKYWRIGDSFLDMFTYYSETGFANVHTMITDFTPGQLGLLPTFLGPPASVVPANMTFRQYLLAHGWTGGDVLRGDSRQEIDMPLQLGDLKVTPYLTGRVTAWDDAFPQGESGSTTRVSGAAGIRSSMQFWHVYEDVQSTFFDVHRLRHVIEPQFNVFIADSDKQQKDLQPFDPDVEGISRASGTQLTLAQKWQTKRGGEGHWRDVDWIVLNVTWNQFWNKDDTGTFFPQDPTRGFFFPSRPELSLVQNTVNVDGIWRVGERVRLMGEGIYGTSDHRVEQVALGLAVDQTDNLSYFLGNRYIRALKTDEWTAAVDYHITKKYEVIAAESYDFQVRSNILSSITIIRKLPRFNTALTISYDANNSDTSVVFTAWPEGFPSSSGFGTNSGSSIDRR